MKKNQKEGLCAGFHVKRSHCNLLILCNLGEKLDCDRKPCMLLLDSLVKQIPKVPQQTDDKKCGQYMLYYIYKFLLACPKNFKIDEDFPSFMGENWFTNNDVEEFCADLPTLYAQMLSEEGSKLNENNSITDGSEREKGVEKLDHEMNQTENEQEIQKGEKTDCNKKFESENALVESPAVFEPFDALRALVLYSPDSSQQKQVTVQPSMSSVEEIPTERENKKEKTVTMVKKLKINVRKETNSLQNETNDRGAEEEKNAEPKVKKVREKKMTHHKNLEEKRKSPRLMTDHAKSNDETTTSASGGKNKKGTFNINDDGDSDLEKTLPRKSPKKVRVTTVEEKPQGKKRKNLVQAEEKNKKKQKLDKPENESEKNVGMPKKLLIRAYPSTFSNVIDGLSSAQKEWVREVGFGSLLSFSLRTIPHEIGINVIWWFDHLNYEMSFGKDRKIKICEEDMNDILGLPRGEKEVEYKTDKKKDDEQVKEWREKFQMRKDDSKITEKMICDASGRSEDADLFFKQNFMVLMTNIFVRTNKSSFVDQYAVSFKGDFDKGKDYNWCKEVFKNLKEAHELWFEKSPYTILYWFPRVSTFSLP
ncbi:hypothetical protein POM88_006653 [Heracleum sosnowskyi]|uniref:Ubiquitin-like protease family profile domain-containing protein n=1 Tax=Heracleum sosnowskyi TaxID=360622 RepID=A0AAD8J6P1_9APIA|nr:hypothetical protein POM88_006653 [Heracleum sosnowskyi]